MMTSTLDSENKDKDKDKEFLTLWGLTKFLMKHSVSSPSSLHSETFSINGVNSNITHVDTPPLPLIHSTIPPSPSSSSSSSPTVTSKKIRLRPSPPSPSQKYFLYGLSLVGITFASYAIYTMYKKYYRQYFPLLPPPSPPPPTPSSSPSQSISPPTLSSMLIRSLSTLQSKCSTQGDLEQFLYDYLIVQSLSPFQSSVLRSPSPSPSLPSFSLDTFSSIPEDLRLLIVQWVLLFTTLELLSCDEKGKYDKLILKYQLYEYKLCWDILNLNINNPSSSTPTTSSLDNNLATRLLKLEVAHKMKDFVKMTNELHTIIYQTPSTSSTSSSHPLIRRDLTYEELVLTFTSLPIIGHFPLFLSFGNEILSYQKSLKSFHISALQRKDIIDFMILHEVAEDITMLDTYIKERERGDSTPSGLPLLSTSSQSLLDICPSICEMVLSPSLSSPSPYLSSPYELQSIEYNTKNFVMRFHDVIGYMSNTHEGDHNVNNTQRNTVEEINISDYDEDLYHTLCTEFDPSHRKEWISSLSPTMSPPLLSITGYVAQMDSSSSLTIPLSGITTSHRGEEIIMRGFVELQQQQKGRGGGGGTDSSHGGYKTPIKGVSMSTLSPPTSFSSSFPLSPSPLPNPHDNKILLPPSPIVEENGKSLSFTSTSSSSTPFRFIQWEQYELQRDGMSNVWRGKYSMGQRKIMKGIGEQEGKRMVAVGKPSMGNGNGSKGTLSGKIVEIIAMFDVIIEMNVVKPEE